MANVYGTTGYDQLYGTSYSDNMYGFASNDTLRGYSGNDYLSGGAGADWLMGGDGNDTVYGGTGNDFLEGGVNSGYDTFRFYQGDSVATNAGADRIGDWNVNYDLIDMPYAGTSGNYQEASTSATSMAAARYQVESNPDLYEERHVFLYNTSTDTGYLLSDLNGNDIFETGVTLLYSGKASDMGYSDII